jgi:hypothetical protein
VTGNVVGAATDKADDLAGDAVSGTPKWLIPGLFGLAIIAGALYTMKGCGTTTTTPPTGGITTPAAKASPAATKGALTDVKLPDGTTLKGAAELVTMGVDKARLDPEGYSDQNPMADNATTRHQDPPLDDRHLGARKQATEHRARAAFIGLPCPTKSAGAVPCPSAFLGFASRLSGV